MSVDWVAFPEAVAAIALSLAVVVAWVAGLHGFLWLASYRGLRPFWVIAGIWTALPFIAMPFLMVLRPA